MFQQKLLAYSQGWKKILIIAWPLIVCNSFWNLQLTIDRLFLSQYSTESLGAAMAVMGVFWTPMALLQQTAAYLMTFVAQYYGAKRFQDIGPAVWQALYFSVFGGILFLGLIPLSTPFFNMIGHSENLVPLEINYFNALCYSALPTAIVAAASAFFTGLGKSQTVIGINAVGLVSNVIFDYLLIFGHFGFPELGIAGAGYATALANLMSAFYGLFLIFQKKHAVIYGLFSGWQFDKSLMKRYIRYGMPSGLQWALEGLAFTIFLIFVGRMNQGDIFLASSGIVVTLMMLAVLPALGVAQAVSVLVGQHLGDNNPKEAEQATWQGWQVSLMYIVVVAISFAIFPNFYLNWFANSDNQNIWAQVQPVARILLYYVAVFTIFDSMNLVFSFALKGAGDTRFVTLVALLLPWPLMVLPTALIGHWENAIYWAWAATSFFIMTQAFFFLARFRGGKWKNMRVID